MDWFIQLHRKLLEWEWYDDINTKVLFIHLLLKANYKPKNWRGIDIWTGEVLTWRIVLSDETWLTQQQIRTSLNKLKSTNEITIKPTNKYSIIKLTNYIDYQQVNQQTTKQVTNNQPTSNQQVTTTNKDNKEIKKINKYQSKDWCSLEEVKVELWKFIDYWNLTYQENRRVTKDLLDIYKVRRKDYIKKDISEWFKSYNVKKKDTDDKQFLLSPMWFLTNKKNWLISYL